jgi:putative chitinase
MMYPLMTPDLLVQAVGCTSQHAEEFAAPLTQMMANYQITTPIRQAAFLAQIGHESGSFQFLTELWGPTEWQERYEGNQSLGNIYPGDGFRFRGRGLIQITGRDNYETCADALSLNCVEDPDLLSQPLYAAQSSAWWWSRHGCNELADQGQFDRITRTINGGMNGSEDRHARWERAKKALRL